MLKKHKFVIISLFFFLTVILGILLAYSIGYRINVTPSFPLGLYKMEKNKKIHKGQLVLFCPPDTQAFRQANHGYVKKVSLACENRYTALIKKIAALPGDHVLMNSYVYINGKKWPNSRIFNKDFNSHPLQPTEEKSFIVPDGKFLAMSDYLQFSFDSRYFGLVPLKLIEGELTPVWVWDVPRLKELNEYNISDPATIKKIITSKRTPEPHPI